MKHALWMMTPVLVAMLLAGCAQAPEDEVQQARDALRSAEEAGAERYAPEPLTRARESMNQLENELGQQQDRFFLTRNYDQARELARQVQNAAREALERAEQEMGRLRSQASAAIDEAQTSLNTARERLAGAAAEAVGSLRRRLDDAESRIAQARDDLEAERFDSAVRNAAAARETTRSVLRELERMSGRAPSRKR